MVVSEVVFTVKQSWLGGQSGQSGSIVVIRTVVCLAALLPPLAQTGLPIHLVTAQNRFSQLLLLLRFVVLDVMLENEPGILLSLLNQVIQPLLSGLWVILDNRSASAFRLGFDHSWDDVIVGCLAHDLLCDLLSFHCLFGQTTPLIRKNVL